MKSSEFYRVLVPLINQILTGSNTIRFISDKIALSPEFIYSLSSTKTTKFDPHFLECITDYFSILNDDQRQDFTRFFVENRNLISMVLLIRDIDSDDTHPKKDYNTEITLLLFGFLDSKTLDTRLQLTLYLYLENLRQIEIDEKAISTNTYNKLITYNSRMRTYEEVINKLF